MRFMYWRDKRFSIFSTEIRYMYVNDIVWLFYLLIMFRNIAIINGKRFNIITLNIYYLP